MVVLEGKYEYVAQFPVIFYHAPYNIHIFPLPLIFLSFLSLLGFSPLTFSLLPFILIPLLLAMDSDSENEKYETRIVSCHCGDAIFMKLHHGQSSLILEDGDFQLP